ncbi:MAG: tRNA uridine-5-carboxymethylaminomethyl(34) synthesis GTPase MnmE [Lachnospiraceae bacterium]|nr:tRNA uridine-5-carboxymethylaminomethyl(34) synthesis GTPase MnmE [Lachnospiraceae bacterium]
MNRDTIGAISTGMSNSGIGIVRIIGSDALKVIDKIYKGKVLLSKVDSHTIHYGYIINKEDMIDEVLVSVMRAPRTYTGEDTVEINCHGGTFVVQKVLETVINHGARLAEPGEISKRAFLNGKMDLSQAEAVIDLIHAKNEYALKGSLYQLKGNVKKKIGLIREEILYHTAFIESALDDPEHFEFTGYEEKLYCSIVDIVNRVNNLIKQVDEGRVIKEGIQTVIIGKPNVGKSSLLNVFAGKERAIVTDIEGTTRDILEEHINLGGLSLNIIDTAGIRETEDIIEKMGVNKAKEYVENSDLIIYVVDAAKPLDKNDGKIVSLLSNKKVIVLLNKSDLKMVVNPLDVKAVLAVDTPIIEISAKEEQGIQEVIDVLHEMFLQGKVTWNDEMYMGGLRQKHALSEALNSLNKVLESIDAKMPEDFLSIDLMAAYEFLGEITGETVGEDLIHEIFSKFCMGK